MRRISIFGATGSIGTSTLDIVRARKSDFDIDVLSGGQNADLLAAQAREFMPRQVVIADADQRDTLQRLLADTDIQITAGRDALLDAARAPVDLVMSGVVGFAGLDISMIAAEHCDVLALANKESLVCAGQLLPQLCAEHGTTLLPVDSEHSAIFQCLTGEEPKSVERVIITASGGPFLHSSLEQMRGVTPEQAAKHPNWSMGLRISIDSATMFNKAMEVIEAREMFALRPDQIEVMVHPQSIVHSLVGFTDGNLMAQMGPPNMKGPIGYALNWPDRQFVDQKRLGVDDLANLTFLPVDATKFPALTLANRAMALGGVAGSVFNAAKEQALDLFLAGDIGLLDMATLVGQALDQYQTCDWAKSLTIDNVRHADQQTREFVKLTAQRIPRNV